MHACYCLVYICFAFDLDPFHVIELIEGVCVAVSKLAQWEIEHLLGIVIREEVDLLFVLWITR